LEPPTYNEDKGNRSQTTESNITTRALPVTNRTLDLIPTLILLPNSTQSTASQKKQDTLLMSITSWNIDRFSKFFHCQTKHKIFYVEHCIFHHTLKMLLHYLVKPLCFKTRINSKFQVHIFTNQIFFKLVKESTFFSNMCAKEVPEYYKLVLNTLCMTNLVRHQLFCLQLRHR